MSSIIRFSLAMLLLVFISCNPDEDLDNNGNSVNNGNNGNNGGGNTINPVSYPEIVNLLEGNWYGVSKVAYLSDGTEFMSFDQTGTLGSGYLTFGSNVIGTVDLNSLDISGLLPPPVHDLQVAKYPASVTITDGSWSGSGGETLQGGFGIDGIYAYEYNAYSDKSYCIVKYQTPFFGVNTSTIEYAIVNKSIYGTYNSDIQVGSITTEESMPFMRIHTLNDTILKLAQTWGATGYVIYNFEKE
jgi:hypothetical protein